MSHTNDLTKGKVLPIILKFFFPMLFTNMLQQLYTIADTAIVGKGLGDNALAAVGNMSSLTFLVIGFSMGLANGFCVLIGQRFGAKDFNGMRRAVASSIKLSLAISVILTALSIAGLRSVLVLLQTDESIIEDSLLYGYIIFGGLITTIAYNLCSGILRSLGDSRTPLTAIIASSIINVVLNSVFIFGFGSGVDGAAAATIISQIVSTIICYRKLRKIDILQISADDFRTDIDMYGYLLKNGVPMAFMNSITAIGCMVVQYFVNGLGVAYTSAYSACSKFGNLFMQPACTAGASLVSFTSQNYGAGKYSRIRKGVMVCSGIALISYFIFGSVMCFFPEWLAKLMLNEAYTIALAAEYLPICGVMLFTVDLLFIFRNAVQGMGSPFIPMCSGFVEMVMRIGVIVLFISEFGFKATAFAECVAWTGAFLLNFIAYKVLYRQLSKLESPENIKEAEESRIFSKNFTSDHCRLYRCKLK